MTDLKNSNDAEETPGANSQSRHGSDDWQDFVSEHSNDLKDVEHSRTARKFNKHAEKEEKKALLNVQDLDKDSFVSSSRPRGPRDFSGRSWLDTDDVMDEHGDDFVPPNPDLGHPSMTKVVLWVLFLVGVAGIILSVFVPKFAGLLGVIFGVCLLIGAGGLVTLHKGHDETKTDYFDDGARV